MICFKINKKLIKLWNKNTLKKKDNNTKVDFPENLKYIIA